MAHMPRLRERGKRRNQMDKEHVKGTADKAKGRYQGYGRQGYGRLRRLMGLDLPTNRHEH
jgi:hypothetical protein